MVLDRELTIQELLFNKPIEISKSIQLEAGGITTDNIIDVTPALTLDLDAAQFHADPTFFEKLVKHFGENWGWYAGAIAIGIVAYHSLKSNGKEKINKINGFRSINGFIPFPDVPSQPIKIDTKPIVSMRMYIDESKSKQINTY
jgi:hypothetical protein